MAGGICWHESLARTPFSLRRSTQSEGERVGRGECGYLCVPAASDCWGISHSAGGLPDLQLPRHPLLYSAQSPPTVPARPHARTDDKEECQVVDEFEVRRTRGVAVPYGFVDWGERDCNRVPRAQGGACPKMTTYGVDSWHAVHDRERLDCDYWLYRDYPVFDSDIFRRRSGFEFS
jgi:hypothetical protein